MNKIQFDWADKKNLTNIKKHNINFEEAKTVFYDPSALVIYDPDHSIEENRFLILDISQNLRILVVCHCYKNNDDTIRIISARKANQR